MNWLIYNLITNRNAMTVHGERAEKMGHAGREYWSRRPGPRMGLWGRISKFFTHRAERRQAKREAKRAFDEAQKRVDPNDPHGYDY